MKRLFERMFDPDTFLRVWAGVMVVWLALIITLIIISIHFISKWW